MNTKLHWIVAVPVISMHLGVRRYSVNAYTQAQAEYLGTCNAECEGFSVDPARSVTADLD